MTLAHWASAAALLGIAMTATAQQASNPQQPASLETASPALTYDSAFATYRPFLEPETPPDKGWRGANDKVQGQGGHGAHIKPPTPAEPGPAAQQPAAQRPATSIQTKPGGHSGHH